MISSDRRPVLFVMIGAMTPVGGAFQAGANFVLYNRSKRAGAHSMRPRAFHEPGPAAFARHPVQTLVYLHSCPRTAALMLDVSEQGLALQAPEPLLSVQEVPLRFVLPGTAHSIEPLDKSSGPTRTVALECSSPVSRRYREILERLAQQTRRLKKQRCSAVLLEPERGGSSGEFPVRVAGSTGRRANHLQVLAC